MLVRLGVAVLFRETEVDDVYLQFHTAFHSTGRSVFVHSKLVSSDNMSERFGNPTLSTPVPGMAR